MTPQWKLRPYKTSRDGCSSKYIGIIFISSLPYKFSIKKAQSKPIVKHRAEKTHGPRRETGKIYLQKSMNKQNRFMTPMTSTNRRYQKRAERTLRENTTNNRREELGNHHCRDCSILSLKFLQISTRSVFNPLCCNKRSTSDTLPASESLPNTPPPTLIES